MTKLDRKRSYGTVYGDPNVGFVQDGKNFRHDGTLLDAPAEPAATSPPASPPASSPASEERRAAQSQAMKRIWAERREALAQQRSSEEEPPDTPAQ